MHQRVHLPSCNSIATPSILLEEARHDDEHEDDEEAMDDVDEKAYCSSSKFVCEARPHGGH